MNNIVQSRLYMHYNVFNFNQLHAQVSLFDEPQRDQDLGCIPTVLLRFAAALSNKHEIYHQRAPDIVVKSSYTKANKKYK